MKKYIAATLVSTLALAACGAPISNAIYAPSVTEFTTAAGAMKTAATPTLKAIADHKRNLYLNEAPLVLVQQSALEDKVQDPQEFVCGPLRQQVIAERQLALVGSASTQLSELMKQTEDKLGPLFAALFAEYDVTLDRQSAEDAADAAQDRCYEDFENIGTQIYGDGGSQEKGILSAGFALWDTINEVLGGIMKSGLSSVDRARRAEAVTRFFTDPNNTCTDSELADPNSKKPCHVTKLKLAIDDTGAQLENSYRRDRTDKAHAAFLAHQAYLAAFEQTQSALSKAGNGEALPTDKKALAKISKAEQNVRKSCATTMQKPVEDREFKGLRLDSYIRCHEAVQATLAAPRAKALAAAKTYDGLNSKTATAATKKLSDSLERIAKVATGELNAAERQLLVEAMIKWLQLAKSVEDLGSNDEQKEKLEKAYKALLDEI